MGAGRITWEQIESWLSPARYSRYLEAADGDDGAALELYLWSTGLAQAVLRDVSFFEIALHNSYERCLDEWWSSAGHSAHWLLDPRSPLREPIMHTNKRKRSFDANRMGFYGPKGGLLEVADWITFRG